MKKYYAVATLMFTTKSKRNFEEMCQLFDGQAMTADLVIKTVNGETLTTDVMEFLEMEWENDEE